MFGNKILSRFRTVSEGGILAINEAGVSTITQKETKFGLSVLTGKEKTFFLLNLRQNLKKLIKIKT